MKVFFGTDGIRDKFGSNLMHPENLLKIGWAIGKYAVNNNAAKNKPKIIIGKDTRISGYVIESVLEAGLISAGVDVILVGPLPTPAISLLVKSFSCDFGIAISASHNLYQDNGIKVFNSTGQKTDSNFEREIKQIFKKKMDVCPHNTLGKAIRVDDASSRYIEYCKSCYTCEQSLKNFKILVDCAHGANYQIAPKVYRELGAQVKAIHAKPNGFNINYKSGVTDLKNAIKKIKNGDFNLGIVFDGDGDRLYFLDKTGRVYDGDDILYILVKFHHLITGKKVLKVAGTIMSNSALENSIKDQGIDFIRTKVGDKYLIGKINKYNLLFAAEPSGHIICANHSKTGDAIIASLQILNICNQLNKDINELIAGFSKFPSALNNIKTTNLIPKNLLLKNKILEKEINKCKQKIEAEYKSGIRIVIRQSGTEPLIRVMVEAENKNLVEEVSSKLVNKIKNHFSSDILCDPSQTKK